MIWGSGIDKTKRLMTINCLIEMAMEKVILNIQLMNQPRPEGSNAEYGTDGGGLDYWTEHLVIVNTMLLRIVTNDPPSFMSS